MKEGQYAVKYSSDGHVSLEEAPRTPKSSGRVTKRGTPSHGLYSNTMSSPKEVEIASPRTPSKRKSEASDDENWTPSKKSSAGTPRKAMKWEDWETDLIKKAIILDGERHINWHTVLGNINNQRESSEARTLGALKIYWTNTLKKKF